MVPLALHKKQALLITLFFIYSSIIFAQNPNYWTAKTSMYTVLPNSEGEIVLLGDSITDRCEWAELFENDNVINRGLSGDRTAGILERLGEVIESKPEKIFIMIGVNDLRHNYTITSITENYKEIIETIQESSPKTTIYIQSILPVNVEIGTPKTKNWRIRKMNEIIKDLANDFNIEYIDIHAALLDKDNKLDVQYSEDGLHINGKGYLVWKSILEKYIGKSNQEHEVPLKLVKTIEVEGRQGVAVDANNFYVSGSKALYKYDKEGDLLLSNTKPFDNLPLKANHLGDIDFYKGEIYTGVEFFNNGSAKDIQIVIYDAETLKFKRFFKWNEGSGQKEVCAVTVDATNKLVWMADWIDGSYVYKYDLESGNYLGKIHLFPVPEKQQGIKVIGAKLYITADDGDAELSEPDHLYAFTFNKNTTQAKVELVKTFDDVKLNGEIEGLTYDELSGNLIVHFNRGTRVVNGMPIGFYKGYTKEIHELYIYK